MRRELLAIAAIAAVVVVAKADLLYYDGFPTTGENAYPIEQLAKTVNNPQHASIVGFKDDSNNKWSAGSTANQIWSDTLSYPSAITLSTQEGEYTCGRASGSPRGAYRTLSSPALTQSVLYFSFLMRYHGAFPDKFTEDFVAFGTHGVSGTNSPLSRNFGADGFVVSMTNMGDHVEMHLKTEENRQTLLSPVSAGTTYFVVVKYENNTGAPHVISASVLTEPVEPETWDATITTAARSGRPTKMQVGGYGPNSTANYWEFDEVRIGTAFTDVAGVAATGTPAVFDGLTSINSVAYEEGETTASATLSAAFSDAASHAAEVVLYWGESNGGTDTSAWGNYVSLGTLDGLSAERTLTGLPLGRTFFYRFAAVNGNVVTWGSPAQSAFVTAEMTPVAPGDIDECSVDPAVVSIGPGFASGGDIPVAIALGGTASIGVDYTCATPTSVTLSSGDASTSCDVFPVRNLSESDAKTVTLTVLAGPYILPSVPTVSFTITDAVLPSAPTNAFLGTVSGLAGVADNWTLGHVPTAGETVLYDLRYGRVDLEWDVAAPKSVGAWVQSANQTNRVVFSTTVAEPLAIAGDVELLGGVWTHAGPAADPVYSLSVAVGGNMTVGVGAAINVGCAINTIDPQGLSRGYFKSGLGYVENSGGAFGGEAFGNTAAALNDNCYGSILNPLVWGASARGSGAAASKYAGPGLVNLSVAGELALAGGIYANGFAAYNNGGGASGGAVNLTCGRFTGAGTIKANGGGDPYAGSGSGGRVRVNLTASGASSDDFTGIVEAYGGIGGNPGNTALYDTPSTAAGTVFWQEPSDGPLAGDVWVVNSVAQRTMTNETTRVYPATQLPPRHRDAADATYAQTRWHLGDNAKLRLTASVTVKSIDFLSPSGSATAPVLFTDGYDLRVAAATIDGVRLKSGSYTAADFPNALFGEGSLTVGAGLLVVIR